jgi:hypothetical protein
LQNCGPRLIQRQLERLGYHGFPRKPQNRYVLKKTKIDIAKLKALASGTLLQSSPGGDGVATGRNCLCLHMVAISTQQAAHPMDADSGEDGFREANTRGMPNDSGGHAHNTVAHELRTAGDGSAHAARAG